MVVNEQHWGQIVALGEAFAIAELAQRSTKPILVITPDIHRIEPLIDELSLFIPANCLPILHFPDWETLPYDHFSPHQGIISERLATLYQMGQLKEGIIIAALPTLMHRLLPSDHLYQHLFAAKVGETLNIDQWRNHLIQAGYRATQQVLEHGEFSVRGAIIDAYPMGSPLPIRIELFDNTIESIRYFDPETQRSLQKVNEIKLLPAHEFPLTDEAITHFRQTWRARFAGNPTESPIYQQISEKEASPGIEYYLSLFYEKLSSFFDYLPKETQIIAPDILNHSAEQFLREITERYEQCRHDIHRPVCSPNEIFIPINDFFSTMGSFDTVVTSLKTLESQPNQRNFHFSELPDISVNTKSHSPLEKLKNYLKKCEQQKIRVLFCAESLGRQEILSELLNQNKINATLIQNWSDFLKSSTSLGLIVSPITESVLLEQEKISIISENALFKEQVMQRRLRKKIAHDPELMIRNLSELSIGECVVHSQHGIGRYLGLQTLITDDVQAEYLSLEYADGDKIYVPVTSLHLISRYSGAPNSSVTLQKLGTKQWDRIKQKAAEKIRDTAAELLDVYSRRQAAKGHAFSPPNQDFQLFTQAFSFEPTLDQLSATQDVIKDMTSPQCMDRLVCGDVGFGKTEVAMRAAFLAVQDQKQVAILVPTTLLANQHLESFQDRFANWPVRMAGISRLRSAKEQKEIIDDLANGKIDIIIGTHKLLSKEIRFKDLGLLVVDEEQRFGVHQKERIKSLRAHVDILTLTATPIPRTMNMALAGTRDLSIIATPPAKRLSIKTFVHERSESLIREAVLREILRGGQVYFLHNDISTMEANAQKLQSIVPEARILIAHGQMHEHQLEKVMSDFYHQKSNVLICTTIIESGIDIPSANTIIIERADKFGLSQLHQLRGRVGRSHHQAYAYLITPPRKSMTDDAHKRLDAIAELGELGIGFHLATHDLEIRGAGELLGQEQSGHMQEIGFSLYMELLEQAVNSLKSGHQPNFEESFKEDTEIELGVSALLPENYVPDVHTRLIFYKRLATCKNNEEIREIKEELIDRFGLFPDQAKNLFLQTELKVKIKPMGIKKLRFSKDFSTVHFTEKPHINTQKLIQLIQQKPKQYQLQGGSMLRMRNAHPTFDKAIEALESLLSVLKVG